MISCDECQKELVALFDNEALDNDDSESLRAHLQGCPECRDFRKNMARLRQEFVSTPLSGLSPSMKQELLQIAQADSTRRENQPNRNESKHRLLLFQFPRLAWAAGLAAMILLVASWLVSLNLARKVGTLRQELEASRQEIALAKEKTHLEDVQERQEKVVSGLRIRVRQLEGQMQRGVSPRMAWLSESPDCRPERPAGL